jgi:hypothetical protein
MIMVMFTAFFSAGFAGGCTDQAKFFCFCTIEAHQLSGSIAECGTFHIQLYTFRHHLYIFFLCAGRSAMITGGRTLETGFYTGGIVIVHHKFLRLGSSFMPVIVSNAVPVAIRSARVPVPALKLRHPRYIYDRQVKISFRKLVVDNQFESREKTSHAI